MATNKMFNRSIRNVILVVVLGLMALKNTQAYKINPKLEKGMMKFIFFLFLVEFVTNNFNLFLFTYNTHNTFFIEIVFFFAIKFDKIYFNISQNVEFLNCFYDSKGDVFVLSIFYIIWVAGFKLSFIFFFFFKF